MSICSANQTMGQIWVVAEAGLDHCDVKPTSSDFFLESRREGQSLRARNLPIMTAGEPNYGARQTGWPEPMASATLAVVGRR